MLDGEDDPLKGLERGSRAISLIPHLAHHLTRRGRPEILSTATCLCIFWRDHSSAILLERLCPITNCMALAAIIFKMTSGERGRLNIASHARPTGISYFDGREFSS